MPLCGLRSQAHPFMCNSKTLASKLLLFKGEVVTTPLPPSNCSLCFCVPAFLPRHSLFCLELGRNDKSKTENKLLESL